MRLPRAKSLAAGIGLLLISNLIVAIPTAGGDDASKRVKIVGGEVELTDLTATASQCGKQKGETA